MNSRLKGKRGELEAARELERLGLGKGRRGQQFNGIEGRDVLCDGLPDCHIEVKRTETFNAYAAIEQAVRDAGGRLPFVMHKRNRRDWLFVVRADDLLPLAFRLVRAFEQSAERSADERVWKDGDQIDGLPLTLRENRA